MRMFEKAVTLVEVLVVIAILTLLTSIGLAVSSPMREKAKQASCASQLGQIYKGLLLYSTDAEPGEEFPGVTGVSLFALTDYDLLVPYIGSKEVLFCPDAPPAVHRHMKATYTTNLIPMKIFELHQNLLPLFEPQMQMLASREQLYPMIYCSMHDEFFYQPREADVSPLISSPFYQELTLAGSVLLRREPSMIRGTLPPDALN